MNSRYKVLTLAALAFGFGFTACDDDTYTDWAQPQVNGPEAPIELSFTAAAAAAVDFAVVDDDVERVTVINPSVSGVEGATAKYELLLDGKKALAVAADGTVSAADLKAAVAELYGRAPEARTMSSKVYAYITVDGTTYKKSTDITITTTLKAPVIEDAYYYIGAANGWNTEDKSFPFVRADEKVSKYDDPVFTVVVPASFDAEDPTVRVDEWFKIAPASAYGAEFNWDAIIGAETDGCTDAFAFLAFENAQAFMQPASDGALMYRLELNMMDGTISITPVSFTEFVYAPGNGQGWNPETAAALRSENSDGYYDGYSWLDGGFKFTKARNWSDGEYNASHFFEMSENFAQEAPDNTNISCSAPGFYKLRLDMTGTGVLEATLTSWGIIGPAQPGGWDTDVDMEYDSNTGAWTWTGTLEAGEFKFRANDGWDINVGGDMNNLTNGGDNISLAESGMYTVNLYLQRTDKKEMYCTVVKQ